MGNSYYHNDTKVANSFILSCIQDKAMQNAMFASCAEEKQKNNAIYEDIKRKDENETIDMAYAIIKRTNPFDSQNAV